MILIRAMLAFDTSTARWIVSAKDSDYFGLSASAATLEQAVIDLATELNTTFQGKPFQILIGGR